MLIAPAAPVPPAAENAIATAAAPLSYDAKEALLQGPAPDGGNKLPRGFVGHPTRQSLYFAVALLRTQRADVLPVAQAVLSRVVELQDQDPQSRTFGVWPKLLEEPLPKETYFDKNWADFFAASLLDVKLEHAARLSPALIARIDGAILNAAQAIQRFDVGPHYTNIAALGTSVVLLAAETYKRDDLQAYALARLCALDDQTRHNGDSFSEYNSPTYTRVALGAINRIRDKTKNPEAVAIARRLNRVAWQEIAGHYHAPSGQWAGPYSRTYGNLGGKELAELIRRADCPPDLRPLFTQPLTTPRTVNTLIFKAGPPIPAMTKHLAAMHPAERVGNSGEYGALTTTTYLHPAFALGTASRGELWTQRRLLLAHWGTLDAPSYLTLRFLRDNKDVALAQFFSVQKKGDVLAGIALATDGATDHVVVKPRPGPWKTKDLRLRFEWGGAAAKNALPVAPAPGTTTVTLPFALPVHLAVPFAVFDNETARWETGRSDKTAWLDLVLYAGPERTVDLEKVARAAVGFALRVATEKSAPLPTPRAALENGTLQLDWNDLSLALPVKPAGVESLHQAFALPKVGKLAARSEGRGARP